MAPRTKSSVTPRHQPSRSHFTLSIPIEDTKADHENLSITIYYCTSLGKVKGQLTLTDDRLEFYPIVCPENKHHDNQQFIIKVDYCDITGYHPVQLFNNTGQHVKVVERKNYMYDFYLQIDLSNVKSSK